jgi:hypothetical protein
MLKPVDWISSVDIVHRGQCQRSARLLRKVLVNASLKHTGIGRMSALGANRTHRDSRNDVNDPERTSPFVHGHLARDARNPVLRGVTFLAETVPGFNPPVVPAADLALWDLSLGETADVDRPLHARVPLRWSREPS